MVIVKKHGEKVAEFRTMSEAMEYVWARFEAGECNENNHSLAPFTTHQEG